MRRTMISLRGFQPPRTSGDAAARPPSPTHSTHGREVGGVRHSGGGLGGHFSANRRLMAQARRTPRGSDGGGAAPPLGSQGETSLEATEKDAVACVVRQRSGDPPPALPSPPSPDTPTADDDRAAAPQRRTRERSYREEEAGEEGGEGEWRHPPIDAVGGAPSPKRRRDEDGDGVGEDGTAAPCPGSLFLLAMEEHAEAHAEVPGLSAAAAGDGGESAPELPDDLVREVEEDLRLSEDIAFTPCRGGGEVSSAYSSQSYLPARQPSTQEAPPTPATPAPPTEAPASAATDAEPVTVPPSIATLQSADDENSNSLGAAPALPTRKRTVFRLEAAPGTPTTPLPPPTAPVPAASSDAPPGGQPAAAAAMGGLCAAEHVHETEAAGGTASPLRQEEHHQEQQQQHAVAEEEREGDEEERPPPPPLQLFLAAAPTGGADAAPKRTRFTFSAGGGPPPEEPPEVNDDGRVSAVVEDSSAPPPADADSWYDLPPTAQVLYASRRGVAALYPWQHNLLTRPDIRGGGNFVYSMPTSGGKTLVAEISLLRCVLNRRQSAFFVVPFVSLAEEKTQALRPFGDVLEFTVDGHYGSTGRYPLPPAPALFVCTIEKANSLLNHLLEEGRGDELGAVVVDELHMVGEPRRGATLELFLSKLLLMRRADDGGGAVQIIGMSATIPNLDVVARWLRAALYEGTERPVPLRQYSVVDGLVLRDGEVNERNLRGRGEVEQLLELAFEEPSASVLIFCASRQQCVDTAKGLVLHAKRMAEGGQSTALLAAAAEQQQRGVTGVLRPNTASAVRALVDELRGLASHSDAVVLAELVQFGVAFHHGGLLAEEREAVEGAYRDRLVRVLCCTSTLAAGVNLPARRVIFKTPYIGREFLTKSRYLQMCGRAGRAGLDAYGESYLLLSRRDRDRGHRLIRQEIEPCLSQMLEDASNLPRALLECVTVGLAPSRAAAVGGWGGSGLLACSALGPIDSAFSETLQRALGQPPPPPPPQQQQTAAEGGDGGTGLQPACRGDPSPAAAAAAVLRPAAYVRQVTEWRSPAEIVTTLLTDALAVLADSGLVACARAEDDVDADAAVSVRPTPFGASAVRSCFSVEEALLVRDELDNLRTTGLILGDDLHLCYFLTPLREVGDCDWRIYADLLAQLSDSQQRIAALLGVNEQFVAMRAMGLGGGRSAHEVPATADGKRDFFTARRFYVALMLADVLCETPLDEVEARYCVRRGQLQSLMRSASMFSSSITSFCHAMEWYSLEAVLASFVKRLGFGVKPDLVPLMEIRNVQPGRARALWNAGYKTPKLIAACEDADEMVRKVKAHNAADNKTAKFFSRRSAVALIREASLLIEHQIREKKDELHRLTDTHN